MPDHDIELGRPPRSPSRELDRQRNRAVFASGAPEPGPQDGIALIAEKRHDLRFGPCEDGLGSRLTENELANWCVQAGQVVILGQLVGIDQASRVFQHVRRRVQPLRRRPGAKPERIHEKNLSHSASRRSGCRAVFLVRGKTCPFSGGVRNVTTRLRPANDRRLRNQGQRRCGARYRSVGRYELRHPTREADPVLTRANAVRASRICGRS